METSNASAGIEELLAHEGFLRRVVAEVVGPEQVDDIVQETWIAALAAQPQRLGYPRAFLKRVARNLALGRRRTEARRRRRESLVASAEALPSTAQMVERLHAHQSVAQAVADLDEPYRTVVLLRFFEDLTPREIARRTGVPASTVRTQIERGLQRVRGRLEGYDVRALAALVLAPRTGESVLPLLVTGRVLKLALGVAAMSVRHKFLSAALLLLIASLAAWLAAPVGQAVQSSSDTASVSTGEPTAPGEPLAAEASRREIAAGSGADTAAAPVMLRGRVVDTRGTPVAGVPLAFHATPGPTAFQGMSGVERAVSAATVDLGVSDHEGRFAAPCDSNWGQIVAGGEHLAVRYYLPGLHGRSDEDALVIVAPRSHIEGIVVDDAGRPLAGVLVRAHIDGLLEFDQPLDHTAMLGLPEVWTEDDGAFVLEPVPATSELAVSFRKDGFTSITRHGLAGERDLRVSLEPSEPGRYRITGTVVDHLGRLVRNATVMLHQSMTTTGRFGEFEIHSGYLAQGSLFGAAVPGYQPTARPDIVTKLLAGEAATDVVLQLGPEALAIEGRVLTPDDEPLEGAVIHIASATQVQVFSTVEDFVAGRTNEMEHAAGRNFKADARSDAEGAFSVGGLRDQDYRLLVFDLETLTATTVEVAAGTTDLVVRLDPEATRRVRGRVTSRRGDALAGLSVSWGLRTVRCGFTVFAPGRYTKTDADGRFAFASVPLGDVEVHVDGPSIVDHEEPLAGVPDDAELTIRPWAQCRVRVQIDDATATRIQLADASGTPLEVQRTMGQVSMSGEGWDLRSGRTPVLEVSEAACILIVLRDGAEIARHDVVVGRSPVDVLHY